MPINNGRYLLACQDEQLLWYSTFFHTHYLHIAPPPFSLFTIIHWSGREANSVAPPFSRIIVNAKQIKTRREVLGTRLILTAAMIQQWMTHCIYSWRRVGFIPEIVSQNIHKSYLHISQAVPTFLSLIANKQMEYKLSSMMYTLLGYYCSIYPT